MNLKRHSALWSSNTAPRNGLIVASCAFGAWLLFCFSRQWFVLDEFAYLRPPGSSSYLKWLVAPHNEHTIIFTKLWFSVLYHVFGMEHYWAYAIPLVLGHVVLVAGAYRLVWRTSGSAVFAFFATLPILVMGGAYGTLTWAGQSQYTWPVALGIWTFALSIEDRHSRRIPAWLFAVLAVAGTFSGSAFLPYGVVSGATLLWFRRIAAGAFVAGAPVAWFLLERMLWDLPSDYAANGVDQVLREGPNFGWLTMDRAISDTVLVSGFGPVLLACLVWGVVAALRTGPRDSLDERRQWAVLLLTASITITVLSIVVARLNYGSNPNGGHSYLVLGSLLPLGAVLVAPVVLNGRRPFQIASTSVCIYLVATSLATIADYAKDIAGFGRESRTAVQGAAALSQDPAFEVVDQSLSPDAVAAPGISWRQIRAATESGRLAAVEPNAETREAISLALQWDATPYLRPVDGCIGYTGSAQVSAGSVLVVSKAATLTLRYPDQTATRPITMTPRHPRRLESTSGRVAEVLPVGQVAFRVCTATEPLP